MMKGFKIDVKGQKRRMKYQEMQRLGYYGKHSGFNTQTKGKLDKFAMRLIK